jgi:glycosyltransferase involved in cell wall biosynthesis
VRILHVVGWLAPRYGGTVEVVSQVVPRLESDGHHVEVWTTNADGKEVIPVDIGVPIRWRGMLVTFHPLKYPKRFLTSWDLLSRLRERASEFDVIHIHSLYRFHTIAASRVAKRKGVPYVIQAHGALDPWNRRQRKLTKSVYHFLVEDSTLRNAAGIVCTSQQEASGIEELDLHVPTRIIPLGVEIDRSLDSPALQRNLPTSLPRDRQWITFLGRISPVKGMDLLVEAFRTIAVAFPSAHLVVAGSDDQGIFASLLPSIEAEGLSSRVSYVGLVAGDTKQALLQASSVFVLPSAGESFGIAAAEAMAAGCPVVVTPRVAIQDMVRSARAGIVAERTSGAVADAVCTVLADDEAAAEMGRAGRRLVRQRLQWSVSVAALESLYQQVART